MELQHTSVTLPKTKLWTRRKLSISFLLLISCLAPAQGEVYEERNLSEILRFEDSGKYLVHLCPLSGVTRLEVRLLADRWEGNYPPLLIEKVKINRKMLAVGEDYKMVVTGSLDSNAGYPQLDVQLNGEKVDGATVNTIPPNLQLQNGSSYITALYLKGRADISVESLSHQSVSTPRGQHTPPAVLIKAGERILKSVEGNKAVTQGTESWNVTVTSTTINTTSSSNTTTPSEGAWWAFVYVLGDVSGVPVLGLLVLSVLLGVGLGCIVTCLCMKRHHRGRYRSVTTEPPPRLHSLTSNADFIKERSTYTFNVDGGELRGNNSFNSGFSSISNNRLAQSNSSSVNESTLNHPFIRTTKSAGRNNSLEPHTKNRNNNNVNNLGKPLVSNSAPSSIERGFNIPITDRVKNNLDRAASGSINTHTFDRYRRNVGGGSANSSIERGLVQSRSPCMSQQGKSWDQDTDDENNSRSYLVPHVLEDTYQTPYGSIPEAITEPQATPYERENSVTQKFDTFRKYRQ